ncbi:MAG: class I SAM-dependent methyltransferase [Euryarchaeota archaeon]|nr:class I SAM-dependent methyltransferase [Euryarchaeota archaeon]
MYELYVLLSEESLARVAPLLGDDRSFLEELYLALATEPVAEIPEEELELLKENVALWRRGYAVPLRALEEVERLSGEELELEFVAMLSSNELEAEPDASFAFAREFCGYVKGERVLDVASGFGWVPVLLSGRAQVYALDSAYANPIVYGEDRIYIEGTTIELFPGFPEGQAFIRANREKFTRYADFAMLFWERHGARLENITLLQGDASSLSTARTLEGDSPLKLAGAFDSVTIFFGLNHVGRAWRRVLREACGALREGGTIHVAIYREYLARFPLKGAYDWAEQLGIEIVPLEELLKEAEALGLKPKLRRHSGESLYHMVVMEKP